MALSPDVLDPRNDLQMYMRDVLKSTEAWPDKLVRQEYSRLRDIAQKRLARLGAAAPESYAYKMNVGKYAPARGQTTEELRQSLPSLARFIAAKTGTLSGIRQQQQKALRKLHQHGYTFVTQENIGDFGKFMEAWRASDAAKVVGSQEVVDSFEFTQSHDINVDAARLKRKFGDYLTQQELVKAYAKKMSEAGKAVSATSISDLLTAYDRVNTDGTDAAREQFLEQYIGSGKQKRKRKK